MSNHPDDHTSSVIGAPQKDWLAKLEKSNNDYLSKAYALSTPAEARDLYDSWAKSYDKDLNDLNYAFPAHTVSALVNAFKAAGSDVENLKILDAGCGTGLIGTVLSSEYNVKHIDGLDISPGMLSLARKANVYRVLEEADLTKSLAKSDGEYDAVVCVGTLTQGHVGPAVLDEFVRVIRREGVLAATVLASIWESGGFKNKVEELQGAGKVEVLGDGEVGLKKGEDTGGRLLLLKKL
jgi:predicted TPR repeat methyltransferase